MSSELDRRLYDVQREQARSFVCYLRRNVQNTLRETVAT